MPNRRQAIIWTNIDPIHWRIYAALGGDVLSLIPAWISNHMPTKVWDETSYLIPNFNGCTVFLFSYFLGVGMENWFHIIFHNGCNYLSMLQWRLIHGSKDGPASGKWLHFDPRILCRVELAAIGVYIAKFGQHAFTCIIHLARLHEYRLINIVRLPIGSFSRQQIIIATFCLAVTLWTSNNRVEPTLVWGEYRRWR